MKNDFGGLAFMCLSKQEVEKAGKELSKVMKKWSDRAKKSNLKFTLVCYKGKIKANTAAIK